MGYIQNTTVFLFGNSILEYGELQFNARKLTYSCHWLKHGWELPLIIMPWYMQTYFQSTLMEFDETNGFSWDSLFIVRMILTSRFMHIEVLKQYNINITCFFINLCDNLDKECCFRITSLS